MAQVLIRQPETGAEYEIAESDYETPGTYVTTEGELVSYAEAGFLVASNPDGTQYTGSLPHVEPEETIAPPTPPKATPKAPA